MRARGTRPASLPAALAREWIREGYGLSYRHLHITGGEPLLWDGLPDLLDYAFTLGFETVLLNTNGTLLAGDRVRGLAAHEGVTLSVSLQGPEPFHDRVRGTGTYRLAVRGVRAALDAGVRVIVFTTVFRSLIPELASFTETIFRRFPEIQRLNLIQLIRVPGDVFDLAEELLEPDDFLRMVRMTALLNLAGLRVYVLNNPLAVAASEQMGMPWVPESNPIFRDGSLLLTAEREITLAHSSMERFGPYQPGLLETVMASREYRQAVGPDERSCPSCRFRVLCRGRGLERPASWYRDTHPEPYCRRVLERAKV